MDALIAVLPGDGIGPEVVVEAVRALKSIADQFGHHFTFQEALIGGAAIDATGQPLPAGTLTLCRRADAILFGAVGGPKWSGPHVAVRPEQGLLALRKELDLFANLRPVKVLDCLADASPLRHDLVRGVDMLFVRELTGGIYFGPKTRTATEATDHCRYTVAEIERVVRLAARLARTRRKKLTSIDKANVLETSRLWQSATTRIMREEFPDVEVEHLLVDAAAMHLLKHPRSFDVIVTENMFGDILTDEASVLAGSIGLLPSASLGNDRRGLYEPIHGSAPSLAGRGIANPYGTLFSAALLLRHSLGLEKEAAWIEQACERTLLNGVWPADLHPAGRSFSTHDIGDAVLASLAELS
jgi:3-isopropylmalate dehydrogenase